MPSCLSVAEPIVFSKPAFAPPCTDQFALTLSHQKPTGQRHDWCYGAANGQGSEEAKANAKCK